LNLSRTFLENFGISNPRVILAQTTQRNLEYYVSES
jgi:hypothetical protein